MCVSCQFSQMVCSFHRPNCPLSFIYLEKHNLRTCVNEHVAHKNFVFFFKNTGHRVPMSNIRENLIPVIYHPVDNCSLIKLDLDSTNLIYFLGGALILIFFDTFFSSG